VIPPPTSRGDSGRISSGAMYPPTDTRVNVAGEHDLLVTHRSNDSSPTVSTCVDPRRLRRLVMRKRYGDGEGAAEGCGGDRRLQVAMLLYLFNCQCLSTA